MIHVWECGRFSVLYVNVCAGFEGGDGSGDLSSDPELVATEDMSGMEDDGLGDFE
jgi:hypothetical protein